MDFLLKIPANSPDEVAKLIIRISVVANAPADEHGRRTCLVEINADDLKARCLLTFESGAFDRFFSDVEQVAKPSTEGTERVATLQSFAGDFELKARGRSRLTHAEFVLRRPRDWTLSAKHLVTSGELLVQTGDGVPARIF